MQKILQTLNHRKVFRVATVYSVVAWLLMQILDIVLPTFNAPLWVNQTLLLLLLLGLPLVTILAWLMDGQTEELDEQKITASQQRKSLIFGGSASSSLAFGLIFLAVTFLLMDRFLFSSNERASTIQNSTDVNQQIVQRTSITLPSNQSIALAEMMPLGVGRKSLAISSQGNFLAYAANESGSLKIYIRPMDSFEAYPLNGTEGGFSPFFSPDEQWLGFLTPTHILKIPVSGGSPQSLTESTNVYGITWGLDNNIVFSEREGRRIASISADGGQKRVLLETTDSVFDPEILPDSRGILLSNASSVIQLFDPEIGVVRPLIPRGRDARYIDTGHIVYTGMESYMAVSFNLETMSIEGSPFPILDGVLTEAIGVSQLTFSNNGILAYIPGTDMGIVTPIWANRNGDETPISLDSRRYGSFDLSPDASQVALSIVDGSDSDIWVYDFDRQTSPQRLTVGRGALFPRWSLDGNDIAFGAQNPVNSDVRARLDIQGSGEVESTRIDADFADLIVPDSWGKNGELIVSASSKADQGLDLYIIDPADQERRPFVVTENSEWGASFSPNNDYVAFTTDVSGQYQINVKRFPPTEERWVISSGYGEEPFWSEDGSEIFYRRGNQWLSIPVKTSPEFEAGVPEVLFEGPYGNVYGISYGVVDNGEKFFLLKQPAQELPKEINIVNNWTKELN